MTYYPFVRIIVILKWTNQSKKLAVLMFCMIGCGMSCHALGKQEGIESTIEHLVDEGLLQIDEE